MIVIIIIISSSSSRSSSNNDNDNDTNSNDNTQEFCDLFPANVAEEANAEASSSAGGRASWTYAYM